jgi:D-sedoheptulose 7-phosphate isomerase
MKSKSSISDFPSAREDVARASEALVSVSKALGALNPEDIVVTAEIIEDCLRRKKRILLLGNGGSCATASHLATDLTLIARDAKFCAYVTALNDNPYLVTAMANDYGFAESGAALVESTSSPDDALLIFSCSGRSPNLVQAANAAARVGVLTILIGSVLAPHSFPASYRILVQSERYSVIEAAHTALVHVVIDLIRSHLGLES